MKTLLTLFVFLLSSTVIANDVSDFQIEGITVGESALDYFSKSEIDKGVFFDYKNKKYYGRYIKINTELYDDLQFHFLKGDEKYIIYAIGGVKYYSNNIDDCYTALDNITTNISSIFSSVRIEKLKEKRAHKADPSGKSTTTDIWLYFNEGAEGFIGCTDWSEEIQATDNLKIVLNSSEFTYWINNLAFK